MADAGWYPDAQDPNAQHYFDGENWTGQRRPNTSNAPDQAAPAAPPDDATVRRGDLPGTPGSAAPPMFHAQEPPSGPDPQTGATTQFQPQQPSSWDQQSGSATAPGWQPVSAPAPTWTPPAQGGYAAQSGYQSAQHDGGWGAHQSAGVAPPQHAGPWQPQGGPNQWAPTPPPRANRRTPLIIAGVAAVALVAGLVTFLVWPDDAPTLTFDGKEVAAGSATLSTAETALNTAVESRHGAKTDDTRCYFARPKTRESGAKKSDVENALRCGPVLFVDGEKSAAYLRVPLTDKESGGKVTLTAPDDVTSIQPTALSDVDLVRPDGKSAPDGVGTLEVPAPPPADKDVLTATSLGSTSPPPSLSGASIIGKDTKVTLARAGEISRYGSGDDARSAPDGQKLIAFQVSYGAGAISSSASSKAALVIDGSTPRDLPSATADSFVVAAVPSGGSPVLRLVNGGFTQTLSLPEGKPGSDNIAVLRRANKSGYVGQTKTVTFKIAQGGRTGSAPVSATATYVRLDFWASGNPTVHASSPRNALLYVKLNYVYKIKPDGKTYGFDPDVIRIKLPSGKYVKARNIATSSDKIQNVFEVPADFTSGTLEIQGSEKSGKTTLTIANKVTFTVRIRSA